MARGGGAGVSVAARICSTWGAGVFRGLGVSCFRVDFDFPLFFVLSEVFFAPDFFLPLVGFGVGVCRRFVFGVGDFFGLAVDWAYASASPGRLRGFSSSTCARRKPAINAPNTSAVARQMRKRTTATQRNRASNAINAYRNNLLKKLQTTRRAAAFYGCDRLPSTSSDQASGVGAAGVRGSRTRIFSRWRRIMAFNLPPSNSSRQVRYIQVSSTMIDASAR